MRHYLFISIFLGLFAVACSPDDEVIPVKKLNVSLETTGEASEEGINASFTLKLEERLDDDIQVELNLGGSATNGEDYETIPQVITISADLLSVKTTVRPIEDFDEEGDEIISISIKSVDNEIIVFGTQEVSIVLKDGPTLEDLKRDEQRPFMVNSFSTDETVSLFYNLKKLAKTSFLVGQQDAFSAFFNNDFGDSDIKKSTGSDPAILGSDFMFITDDENDESPGNWFYQQEQSIKDDVLEAYEKGMVNVFAWHLREPYEGEHFYVSEMSDFQKENAFKSILPGGENHNYYKEKLDKVAEVIGSLKGPSGEAIPIVFRPFHEFDGHWFWWGKPYATELEFIQCWKFTVDYLVKEKGLNNILFAFSPDNQFLAEATYLERYPGDSYVDILGMDNYGDFRDGSSMGTQDANTKLKIVSDLAISKGKVAALTETCYFVEPGVTVVRPNFYSQELFGVLTQNDVQVGFMMFWSNSRDRYCTPIQGEEAYADFMSFINLDQTLLADDLNDVYSITLVPES